jgi:hypothetical protein
VEESAGEAGATGSPADVRSLIRAMSRDNPLWGAPRIQGDLLKLGIAVGESSVSNYMARHRKLPSQTWRTFVDRHVKTMVSIDRSIGSPREANRPPRYLGRNATG